MLPVGRGWRAADRARLATKPGFRPSDTMSLLHTHPSPVLAHAGHGSQTRDYSGEETDGMNETLCPMDFRQAGEIVDDELNRCLINPLPTVGGARGDAAWQQSAGAGAQLGLQLRAAISGIEASMVHAAWLDEPRNGLRGCTCRASSCTASSMPATAAA